MIHFNFTGEYKKDELLEAARSGNEEKLMALLTTLNVNCHASDGRKVRPTELKHRLSLSIGWDNDPELSLSVGWDNDPELSLSVGCRLG